MENIRPIDRNKILISKVRMNILALSNCPLKENQGAGYVILTTAKCLIDLGHTVDIIPPSSLSFLPSLGGKAFNYRMSIGIAKWLYANRKNITKYQLIIVYTAESSLGIFLLKKILKKKIPIVLHSNGLEVKAKYKLEFFKKVLPYSYESKWFHVDKSFLFTYCYKNVDAVLTVSKDERDFAIKMMNISTEKVYSNEPYLPDIFHTYNLNGNKEPIITYCGRWETIKGCDSMEKAIPLILDRYPNFKFRIIGCGRNIQIESRFPANFLSRIEVYPYIETKEEIIQLYNSTSIFLFPSLTESFGLVLAEAMACRCAVITGPNGLAADLVNHVEAIVLQIPSAEKVYEALDQLISDNALRHTLSENGKKRVAQLRRGNYQEKLNNILEAVLHNVQFTSST